MAEKTETQDELNFEIEQEKEDFSRWLESVAGEMNSYSGNFDPEEDDIVTQLLDSEEGYLAPDNKGFPKFYDFPDTDQPRADDLVHYLYTAAFEPDTKIDCTHGRTNATVLTYPSVWDISSGEATCVGILVSRRPRYSHPSARELPDTLLFRAPYIYIGDFACQSEKDLLNLYRTILASRVYTPSPSLWERLKKLFTFGSS